MKTKIQIGLIHRATAERLMMAPSVAGGWIMVGCEAADRTGLWDNVWRLNNSLTPYDHVFLAAIPTSMERVLPIDYDALLKLVDHELQRASARKWALGTREDDVALLTEWRQRIYDTIADQADAVHA